LLMHRLIIRNMVTHDYQCMNCLSVGEEVLVVK